MNGYHLRRAARQLKRKARSDDARGVQLMEIHQRCTRFENVTRELYGTPARVHYQRGRYWVNNQSFTKSDFDQMLLLIEIQAHVKQQPEVADEAEDLRG